MSESEISELDNLKSQITAEDKNSLAFIGSAGAGKTVIISLLRESIFRYFQNNKKYMIHMTSGFTYLKTLSASLYSGKFPGTTDPLHGEKIILEIHAKDPVIKGSNQLIIRDIAGETYDTLFTIPELTTNERIKHVAKYQNSDEGETLGSFAYLMDPKMYVIVLDCSIYETWDQKDAEYSQLMNTLLDFSKSINSGNNKIMKPLAIILTKSDLIPDIPNNSPKELLKDKLPQFFNDLSNLTKYPPPYFKLYVEAKSTTEISLPLSYSRNEYNKLIKWIIDNV